jgi:hypothetical protein
MKVLKFWAPAILMQVVHPTSAAMRMPILSSFVEPDPDQKRAVMYHHLTNLRKRKLETNDICMETTCELFSPISELDADNCFTLPPPDEGLTGSAELHPEGGVVDVVLSGDSKLTLSVTGVEGLCIEDIRYVAFPFVGGECDLDAIPMDQQVFYASFGHWCLGETNTFEVKLPAETVSPVCVAVFTNILSDICKELDCFGPLPLQCTEPKSSKSRSKNSSSPKSRRNLDKLSSKKEKKNTCGTDKYFKKESSRRLTNLFECKEAKCATTFIKIESPKFCINIEPLICANPVSPPCLQTEVGAAVRWKRFDNTNPNSNDAFYVGPGDLGNINCKKQAGVVYQSSMPFKIEYNGDTDNLHASITAGSTSKELTVVLDNNNFPSCPGPLAITSDMWNTLKITIANRGTSKAGIVHLTNVKFNEIELGNFCLQGNGGFKDILVDLGGYDFTEGAVLTGNLVLCGASSEFDSNETDRVEFGFTKVTPLSV